MSELIVEVAETISDEKEKQRRRNAHPSSVAARKRWKHRNREKVLAQAREYNMRPEVAEKRRQSQSADRRNDPEKYRRIGAESFQRNKEKIYKYRRERMSRIPQVKLSSRLRTYMGNVLKKRCGYKLETFLRLIGCGVEELKSHIESQFKPGMTWENWTPNGWHIDHIQPLASFNLQDLGQRLKAFHWNNLRPEWADANRRKNSNHNGHKWRFDDHSVVAVAA